MAEPKTVGEYILEKALGEGSMGTVYLGRRRVTGVQAAVKVLNQEVSRSAETVKRFQREAQLAYKLRHPNIIEVYDHGCADNQHFIAMAYVTGGDLQTLLQSGKRPPWRVSLEMGVQMLSALQHAHEQGVIHRDIKPANILLDHQGRLILTDFGVAHLRDGTRLTQAGALIGTPEFMAPEMFGSEEVDQSVDVYAAGLVLYELLTGQHPFRGQNIKDTLKQVMIKTPAPVHSLNKDVPAAVSELLKRAISRQRSDRPTAGEMVRQLQEVLGPEGAESAAAPPAGPTEQVTVLVCSSPTSEAIKSQVNEHFRRSQAQSFQWLSQGAVVLFGTADEALQCADNALAQFADQGLKISIVSGEFAPSTGSAETELGEFAFSIVERAFAKLSEVKAGSRQVFSPGTLTRSRTLGSPGDDRLVQDLLAELGFSKQGGTLTPPEFIPLPSAQPEEPVTSVAEDEVVIFGPPARQGLSWPTASLLLLVMLGGGWYFWRSRQNGRLTLECSPQKLKISLDRAPAQNYTSGTPLALPPGDHVVRLSASGYRAQELKFKVRGQQSDTLKVQLKRE